MAMGAIGRRDFLGRMGVGAVALTGLGMAPGAYSEGAKKTNVLLLMSDDLCTALSGYGHPQCHTPNLDRIAARGVQFERAYCQFPLCGPSRASIMTGLYPLALGAVGNRQSDFRNRHADVVTLPQLFRQNGYYSARVGKIYHMGVPGDILEGGPGLDDPLSWDEAVNVKGPEQFAPGAMEDLSPKAKHQGSDFIKVEADGDDLVHADGMTAATAVRILRERKDEPFFLAVGMVRPHVPLAAPSSYFTPYPPQEMKLAEVPEDDLDDVPKVAQFQANAVKFGMNEEQQRKVLGAYYASVAYMDAQVGKVLDELERLGLTENTIVVFTSDHGYNLGQHTFWQKQSLFEDAVRVPFLIAAPGVGKPDQKSKRVIELTGLYPTLAELCGLKLSTTIHGESFAELLRNPGEESFSENAAYTAARNSGESICTARWRYTLWKDGRGGVELYDHDQDPGEFTNLAENPKYASVMEELGKRLRAARERAKTIPGA